NYKDLLEDKQTNSTNSGSRSMKLNLNYHHNFSVHSYLLKYFRACTSITNATLEIYLGGPSPHAPGRMENVHTF
ncbi:unnamed protein product, partial [Heterotrigona itama]